MVHSMTGFASKTFVLTVDALNKTNVTIMLKALNSRFFEANCKLPYLFSELENEFVRRMKKAFRRGSINLVVHVDNQNIFKGEVEPALPTIAGYLRAIEKIKSIHQINQSVTLDHLLQLPNVFSAPEQGLDEKSKEIMLSTLDSLIQTVTDARIKEGGALLQDLKSGLAIMHQQIETIQQRSSVLVEEQKQRVHDVVQELVGNETLLAETRKSASYAALDKMDIHEEIVRFKSHLHNINDLLSAETIEKGKRLDFTLQELAREINTISAKSPDATICTCAINIKVEVEKIREQVQNIV